VVLKEATGLLLKPQMFKPQIVPVETIVIDSVDKVPTENGAIELYAMPHPAFVTERGGRLGWREIARGPSRGLPAGPSFRMTAKTNNG
jgi:hypothetical protein